VPAFVRFASTFLKPVQYAIASIPW